jgi:hypothetical protein
VIDYELLAEISCISYFWCRCPVGAQATGTGWDLGWMSAYGNSSEVLTYQAVLECFPEFIARRCSRARVSAYALATPLCN